MYYVCLCMYVIYVCAYVCIYVCMYVCMLCVLCMYVRMYVCILLCMLCIMYVYLCMYVMYVYVCVYLCMYVNVHYIHLTLLLLLFLLLLLLQYCHHSFLPCRFLLPLSLPFRSCSFSFPSPFQKDVMFETNYQVLMLTFSFPSSTGFLCFSPVRRACSLVILVFVFCLQFW